MHPKKPKNVVHSLYPRQRASLSLSRCLSLRLSPSLVYLNPNPRAALRYLGSLVVSDCKQKTEKDQDPKKSNDPHLEASFPP